MLDGLAGGQLVEGGVGERLPGQVPQDRWGGALVEPGHHGAGPLVAWRGRRGGPAARGGSRRRRRRAARAAAAARGSGRTGRRGCGRAGRSPGSCARSRGRGGCRSRRAVRRGCRRGSARPGRSRCSGSTAACRPGTTVCRWSWRSRRVRPAADRAGQGLPRPQLAHSGPSAVRTLTGRRRPQPRQVSWLAGSVIKQFGHSGWPCSSRVAASRMAPQREQGSARDLATQLRQSHCPSIRRLQADHPSAARAGRPRRFRAPRRRTSASISRSTAGARACAPAPVSRFGVVLERPGQPRGAARPGTATACTAVTTVSAGTEGRSR